MRRKQWFIKLRRANFKITDNTKICSKHFTPDSFDQEKFGGTWLKNDAIPTLFDFPKHLTEKESTQQKPSHETVPEVSTQLASNITYERCSFKLEEESISDVEPLASKYSFLISI